MTGLSLSDEQAVAVGKAEIARLVPHAGPMCLLAGVLAWDEAAIRCVATSHREPDHPLRNEACLPVLAGIEYAAQAMALHGALAGGGGRSEAGFLASLREVSCLVDRLDRTEGPLFVEAARLYGEEDRVVYRFLLRSKAGDLLSGRAAVVLRREA